MTSDDISTFLSPRFSICCFKRLAGKGLCLRHYRIRHWEGFPNTRGRRQ